MSLSLPAEQIAEKNRSHTAGAWLWILAVTLADSTVKRIVRNTEDIVYDGDKYTAVYFKMRNIRSSIDASLPRVVISVASAGRPLGGNIETIEGCSIVLTRVNSKLLASDYSDQQQTFRIAGFDEDTQYYNFTLGAPNLLNRRFPLHELTAPECDNVFEDIYCGYSGSLTTCDGSIEQCITRGRITSFGGEMGLQDRARIIV